MKRLESALAQGRDQYTITTSGLKCLPEIAEALEKGTPKAKVMDGIEVDEGFIANLEASVAAWAAEIHRVTTEDRDASEGSARRDVEFFTEMESALKKLKAELDSDGVEVTKTALRIGKKMQRTMQIDSFKSDVDKRLKGVASVRPPSSPAARTPSLTS